MTRGWRAALRTAARALPRSRGRDRRSPAAADRWSAGGAEAADRLPLLGSQLRGRLLQRHAHRRAAGSRTAGPVHLAERAVRITASSSSGMSARSVRGVRRRRFDLQAQQVEQRLGMERLGAGRALEQDHADRVEVRARVDRAAGRPAPAPCNEAFRAGSRCASTHSAQIGQLRDAEIEHLRDDPTARDEDVVGFEVAVDGDRPWHARRREHRAPRSASRAIPPSGSGRTLRLHADAVDDRRERHTIEVLHDDALPPVAAAWPGRER